MEAQFFQGETGWLALRIARYVSGGQIVVPCGNRFRRIGTPPALLRRPLPSVFQIKPAPHLGIAITGDNIAADLFIVIPNGAFFRISYPGRCAVLFSEIKPLAVSKNQVSLDNTIRAAG